jgi:hypothetical protein
MDAKKIKTIEMTCKICEKNAKQLAGKSHAERIAFYREQAKKMEKKIPVLLSELALARRFPRRPVRGGGTENGPEPAPLH